jgi:hypothetical protein
MRNLVLVAMVALVSCGAVNTATLITSTASIACDWGQTRSAASEAWSRGRWEANPIMGSKPSTATVDVYFLSALAVNAAFWIALPRQVRSVAPVAITAAQVDTIAGNIGTTHTLCGARVR